MGVARVVTRGPEAIRGPANIYYTFFSCLHFSSNASWLAGHSQLRLYTRDKQLFHLKLFLIIIGGRFHLKASF